MVNTDIIDTECDFKLSDKCRKTYKQSVRANNQNKARNGGKNICIHCSRKLKMSGRMNPNCVYKDVDDNLFTNIDTEEKAYILGFIAGDGSISKYSGSIVIKIHKKDLDILTKIKDYICPSFNIKTVKDTKGTFTMRSFGVYSTKIVEDICRHLKIQPGKKHRLIRFPDIRNGLKRHFLRGLFDADGGIVSTFAQNLTAAIGIGSEEMIDSIKHYVLQSAGIPCNRYYIPSQDIFKLEWNGTTALDFLGFMYDNTKISMSRKRDLYLDWSTWIPSLTGNGCSGYIDNVVKWAKTDKRAVPPMKSRTSDSGYDLTLIDKVSEGEYATLYTTGLKIQPPYGWYFDLIPRSSIYKTGYLQANSVGVIDRCYIGPIMVPLISLKGAPELPLPIRAVQIVPRPIVHFGVEECDIEETSRSSKGFGSSGGIYEK